MTDREKAIVMAYTGVCMLKEEKFSVFHKYIEEKLGRSIYTHELANATIEKEIKEKVYPDFILLCTSKDGREQVLLSGDGYADGSMVYDMAECPRCGYEYEEGDKDWGKPYCPECGQALLWEAEE